MKRRMAVLLAALMLCCMPMALAKGQEGMTRITVQGSGSVSAVPDIVSVTANVSATEGTMLSAQEKVGGVIASATEKLLALGVLADDLVTTGYSYSPSYSYEGDAPRLIGYQAHHTLRITCREVAMLDGVIAALTDCGVTDIHSISYDVADRTALYQQALELAIRAAESKALTAAAACAKTISGLESLTENGSYDARYAMTASAEDKAVGLNTGIRAGSVTVSASVTAEYAAQ